MIYRRLGRTGLKVSAISVGAFKTFAMTIPDATAEAILRTAYDAGVNYFDGAEAYANGKADELIGDIIARQGWPRENYVLAGKVSSGKWPEATRRGQQRKHIVECCDATLKRFRTDHIDLFFCHRPDDEVTAEEVVVTMNRLLDQGKILYWGTSDHPAEKLIEMHQVAERLGLEGPAMEQTWYNLVGRARIERDLVPVIQRYGTGITAYSPLNGGVLTGKYLDGIPQDSRLANPVFDWVSRPTELRTQVIRQLKGVADDLGVPLHHLALAWALMHPAVACLCCGASRPEQITDNVKALDVIQRLDAPVMARIAGILGDRLQYE
jgi:voltage-dependent potassium channel beta subunit